MRKKAAKKAEALREKAKGGKKGEKEDDKKEKEEEKEVEKEDAKEKGKGKKAAKGKGKAKKEDTPVAPEPSKLARGPSILDYYTAHAGLQEASAPVDKHNNPVGAEYPS